MPTTKIVILNWNGVRHLQRFLPSVVAAATGVATVVVADNGSTDESVAWIQTHYPTVELVLLDRNYGFAEGYNRALRQVEADYYILLNSDVETPNGWLEPLLRCMEQHPEVAACAPKLRSSEQREAFEYAGAAGGYIDYLGYPFCRGRILRSIECDHGQYDDAKAVFWASGAALCCRSRVWRQLGGLDGDYFAHMEEIDLAWRMQLAGWQVRTLPESVVYHYGGGTLQTDSPRKIYLNHRNNLMMLWKCASNGQLLVTMLVRPWLDLLAALTYLLQGHGANFCAVFRAWAGFLIQIGALQRKRRRVLRSAKSLPTIYRGSLLWRYLLGVRRFSDLKWR